MFIHAYVVWIIIAVSTFLRVLTCGLAALFVWFWKPWYAIRVSDWSYGAHGHGVDSLGGELHGIHYVEVWCDGSVMLIVCQ